MGHIYSSTIEGVDGRPIEIETALEQSLPQIHITGLPGPSVKESRDRVRAALQNLGFEVPSQKTVIHLSPAECKKQGSQFDLAIAVGVLAAEGKIRLGSNIAFLGELTLDGRVQRIQFAIPLVECFTALSNVTCIVAPRANEPELSLLPSRKIRLASNLAEVVEYLRGNLELPTPESRQWTPSTNTSGTFDQILGHPLGKRAVQVAVAGRHHLLLSGPPGVGKSLLAKSAQSLLPPLAPEETVEVVKNHSWHDISQLDARPFRAPHHSISTHALLGGGNGWVYPGEATLADLGILFLDEFPEFPRDAIEGLREPLEDRRIHIHRVGRSLKLRARFALIASMNPCPCGYHKSLGTLRCHCTQEQITYYKKKISGPILDRMDLFVSVNPTSLPSANDLTYHEARTAILSAWERQTARYGNPFDRNGTQVVNIDEPPFLLKGVERNWYNARVEESRLSLRAFHKIVRVARTLADLEGAEWIRESHLLEATALRCPSHLLQA